jgi:aspartate aminotransferase-like enzyme
MKTVSDLTFKIADEEWMFEAIHRLNYQTFVEEIPQHEPNPHRRLIDRFHHQNTYFVCLRRRRLLGMVALRAKRPFSLDQKLADLDSYLPHARSLCELRLLTVAPDARAGVICYGLMRALYEYCHRSGHDVAVISATERQLKLYRHLGFVSFGPLVGSQEAQFQPMYITIDRAGSLADSRLRHLRRLPLHGSQANFLPGPVALSQNVRRRFTELPVSHRSESFAADFRATQKLLCDLVNARHVEILMGSGTLANDAIAAQLSLLSSPGWILSHGEFGARLIDHASRFGLAFEVLRTEWGEAFQPERIQRALARSPDRRWLWAVHCETSTGVLNDLSALKEICARHHLRLNLDCISSIGTMPVDLAGVALATAVSGKGLGAFPGLAMVFHDQPLAAAPGRLPRYLDLGYYSANGGIPFTFSSNSLYALRAALENAPCDFASLRELSAWLRSELRGLGWQIVGDENHLSPAVTTIAVPAHLSSSDLGKRLAAAGYLLSYQSGYLLERNWLQICLMGEVQEPELKSLVAELRRASSRPSPYAGAALSRFAQAS